MNDAMKEDVEENAFEDVVREMLKSKRTIRAGVANGRACAIGATAYGTVRRDATRFMSDVSEEKSNESLNRIARAR